MCVEKCKWSGEGENGSTVFILSASSINMGLVWENGKMIVGLGSDRGLR